MNRRRCPVCFNRIDKTALSNIAGHMDNSTRPKPCPGSFQPYAIALADDAGEYTITAADVRELWLAQPRRGRAS